MKKLILSAALLGSMAVIPAAANTTTNSSSSVDRPQIQVRIGNNRRVRRVRVVTSTRTVGAGRNRYRETVQTTYYPNGRVVTRVVSRQRVGWGRYRG
jgi:hypothetical protein